MQQEMPLVEVRAVEFAQQLNQLLMSYPNYRLDGEWLSLGVVDAILYPLRGKQNLEEHERVLLFSAACYLACLVSSAWGKFAGQPQVGVFVRESTEPTILITLRGGELLASEQEHSIDLFEALAKLLRDDFTSIPVYRKNHLLCYKHSNILSPFIAGVVSGASPYSSGPLSGLPEQRQIEHEEPIARYIAASIADTMERQNPLDEVLCRDDFYYLFATLPPDRDDAVPLVKYCVPAWETLSGNYSSDKDRIKVAEILAKSSDDLLAKVGTVLLFSMCEVVPSGFCATLVEAQGLRASRLRQAVYTCRLQQEFEGTWSQLMLRGHTEVAQHYLCIDMQLGLVPLVVFPIISRIALPEFFPLFELLSTGELVPEDVLKSLYQFFENQPSELHLQYAKLYLAHGNFEAAKDSLAQAAAKIEKEEIDKYFCKQVLEAEILLHEKKNTEAIAILLQAIEMPTQDYRGLTEAISQVLLLMLQAGKVDDVAKYAKQYSEQHADSLAPRLFAAGLHIARDEVYEAQEICQWLYQRVSNHPEVFSLIQTLQRRVSMVSEVSD